MKHIVTILAFLSTNSIICVISGLVLNDYFFLFIIGSIFMCFCVSSEFQLDASVLLLSQQAQYKCFIFQFWRSKVQNRLAELVPSGDLRKEFISLPFPAARHCPNSLTYSPMSLQPLLLLHLFLVLFSDHSEIIPSVC